MLPKINSWKTALIHLIRLLSSSLLYMHRMPLWRTVRTTIPSLSVLPLLMILSTTVVLGNPISTSKPKHGTLRVTPRTTITSFRNTTWPTVWKLLYSGSEHPKTAMNTWTAICTNTFKTDSTLAKLILLDLTLSASSSITLAIFTSPFTPKPSTVLNTPLVTRVPTQWVYLTTTVLMSCTHFGTFWCTLSTSASTDPSTILTGLLSSKSPTMLPLRVQAPLPRNQITKTQISKAGIKSPTISLLLNTKVSF